MIMDSSIQEPVVPTIINLPFLHNLYNNYVYIQLNGTACCSDTAISFHYISPPMLYVMYYLVYHLR